MRVFDLECYHALPVGDDPVPLAKNSDIRSQVDPDAGGGASSAGRDRARDMGNLRDHGGTDCCVRRLRGHHGDAGLVDEKLGRLLVASMVPIFLG